MNNTKLSTVKCVVNNCGNKISQNQDYSYFTFPKNDPIRYVIITIELINTNTSILC